MIRIDADTPYMLQTIARAINGETVRTVALDTRVREMEEDLAVMGCLGETGFCRIERCCVLRHALRKATLAFLQTLDDYSLADLLAPGAQLVASLGLRPELEPAE